MNIYSGKSAVEGIAIGRVYVFSSGQSFLTPHECKNTNEEKLRFKDALVQSKQQLDELWKTAVEQVGTESAEIFEIHKIMLDDSDYIDSINNIIESEKVNAEYAVYKTGENFSKIFSQMDNEYMKGRSADVIDISQRVISNLYGNEKSSHTLTEPSIIVAEDLTPSETIQLDRSKILAFVTSKGSVSSHTAILAGVMNIPAIVSADIPIDKTLDGRIAAVDAHSGKIYLDPDSALLVPLKKKLNEDKKRSVLLNQFKGMPTLSADKKKIMLYSNIGSPDDVLSVIENDSEGIGLFRSEFLYLKKRFPPDEEEQFLAYKKVAENMGEKPVIIRTFDLGSDKQADFINTESEENPALGVRGIRLNLMFREMFVSQLRAIYRASNYGNISIMYPMITSLDEIREAKEISREVRDDLINQGIPIGKVSEGVMIETPAAALISDLLADEADFFSIGTNDLIQYTLAADRQNNNLGKTYDIFHPAIFRLIEMICKNAHSHGIWVGVCGELGGKSEVTEKLLSLGIDELSVSPSKTLSMRQTISKISISSRET